MGPSSLDISFQFLGPRSVTIAVSALSSSSDHLPPIGPRAAYEVGGCTWAQKCRCSRLSETRRNKKDRVKQVCMAIM